MSRCLFLLPVLALLIAIPSGLLAAEEVSFYPVAKLTAGDGEVGDFFGETAALSGDTAVVGASGEDERGDIAGAAYVYRWEAGVWRQVAKLTAGDGAHDDQFGLSVAIGADTIVVGAPFDDDQEFESGSAYVFRRDAGGPEAWGQVAKLTAADPQLGDSFGSSVAVSGDTAVVGAPFADGLEFEIGAVYVFRRDAGGPGAWGQVAKLTAADAGILDEFGGSVALSGGTAVVGASSDGDVGPYTGSAYVFRRDAGGPEAWGQVAKLTAADVADHARFGGSVAIHGDTAVVGARLDDAPGGNGSGSAYVFRRDEGGAEEWGQVAKLTAADGEVGDSFGRSVAISGSAVLVGADSDGDLGSFSGSAYIFRETVVDPVLAISGACPGKVTITASGLTPYSRFELFSALAEGTDAIGSGRCVGTLLGLDEARALSMLRANGAGGRSLNRNLSEAACGRYLQIVDLTSCAVSNVGQVP